MANERGQRVKRLATAARELDPEEQTAFLKGLADPDLRQEVESSIASDDEGGLLGKTLLIDSEREETVARPTRHNESRNRSS